jgi:hypothetical protein
MQYLGLPIFSSSTTGPLLVSWDLNKFGQISKICISRFPKNQDYQMILQFFLYFWKYKGLSKSWAYLFLFWFFLTFFGYLSLIFWNFEMNRSLQAHQYDFYFIYKTSTLTLKKICSFSKIFILRFPKIQIIK